MLRAKVGDREKRRVLMLPDMSNRIVEILFFAGILEIAAGLIVAAFISLFIGLIILLVGVLDIAFCYVLPSILRFNSSED